MGKVSQHVARVLYAYLCALSGPGGQITHLVAEQHFEQAHVCEKRRHFYPPALLLIFVRMSDFSKYGEKRSTRVAGARCHGSYIRAGLRAPLAIRCTWKTPMRLYF